MYDVILHVVTGYLEYLQPSDESLSWAVVREQLQLALIIDGKPASQPVRQTCGQCGVSDTIPYSGKFSREKTFADR